MEHTCPSSLDGEADGEHCRKDKGGGLSNLPIRNRNGVRAINANETPTIRLAHLSDVHVTTRGCRWQRSDWLSKRLAAWINLRFLGRGHRFRGATAVLAALMKELRQQRPDAIVFSGDATALGFEEEIKHAAELFGLHLEDRLPGVAVPGNHDYCTTVAINGAFERHFASWQSGVRLDEEIYPFAQRVGELWLIAVNSATPNRWAWDASGGVGAEQLERLRRLLKHLDGGPRVLVTHYPICLASGHAERRTHGLRDLHDVVRVAAEGGIGLWLHGHRHQHYRHRQTSWTPFPVVCAGSSTQQGIWSYSEYTIRNRHLHGVRRIYDHGSKQFRVAETFDLTLL